MKFMKKNQLAILVIALMLVTAGYLNYNTNYEQETIATSTNAVFNSEEEEGNLIASIGDATLVNSNEVIEEKNELAENEDSSQTTSTTTEIETDQQEDYFTNSKLERDKMYSQMIESYQKILESTTITSEQKTIANQEISNINNTKNAIMIAENLIKTKGFKDCVIFVNDKSISVIIQSEQMEQEQIAQVQNIIARELNAEIENIHISNK